MTSSIAVLLLAGGVVAWREARRDAASPPTAPTTDGPPQVVMFIDLGETEEAGGCGAIIHDVREAARRGVATEEIDARDSGKRADHYKLLLAPAVLILDKSGHDVRRFEGEAPETVRAIHDELVRLSPRR